MRNGRLHSRPAAGSIPLTRLRPPLARPAAGLLWLFGIGALILGSFAADATFPAVPVIYCTDLFHPHEDPDDHFDLATLHALPELDVKCLVLDQGRRQQERPGRIPVGQLNRLTGHNIPAFTGLASPLRHPGDSGASQPAEHQGGVDAILDTLRASDRLVTIIAVGSLRDIAAAWNREPNLMRTKVGLLLLFIGEASQPDFREYNVGLDPAAFIAVLRSRLPVAWVPCFDGGLWQNQGHASFWQASHAELLAHASPALIQYFLYALDKETAEPLAFLNAHVDPARQARLLAQQRNLWCTAIFGAAAGRRVVENQGKFEALPAPPGQPRKLLANHGVFGFRGVGIEVDDNAVVRASDKPDAIWLWQFEVRDREHYARAMTEATAALLAQVAPAGQLR